MPYPSEFYLTLAVSGTHYQVRPTGKINLSRRLRGHKDCWYNPNPLKIIEKKKLLLTDWRAPKWSPGTLEKTKASLKQLLQEGFEIYLWQPKGPCLLTKANLSCLDDSTIRGNMTPSSVEFMRREAAKLGIARDKLFFLDDYWIEHLNEQHETKMPRVLRSSYFSNNESKHASTMAYLLHATPPVQHVLSDALPVKYPLMLEAVAKSLSCEVTPAPFRSVFLQEKDCRLPFDGTPFDWSNMEGVEEFRLLGNFQKSTPISKSELLKFLGSMKKPEEFHLHHLNIDKGETLFLWEEVNLSSLKELALGYINLDTKEIEEILSKTPLLESLNLSYDIKLTSPLQLAPNQLPHLKRLQCTGCPIQNLNTLIEAMPHLNYLECYGNASLLELKPNSLLDLEELDYNADEFEPSHLAALLAAAPNLKKITIGVDVGSLLRLNLPRESLKKVESLSCLGPWLTGEDLQTFIQACSSIKTVEINGAKSLMPPFELPRDTLLPLQSIKLKRTGIHPLILETCINHSEHCKTLELDDVSLSEPTALSLKPLTELNNIKIKSSNLSSNQLLSMLSNACNLSSLSLNYGKDPTDFSIEDELPKLALSVLQTLNINSYEKFPSRLLKHILSEAPNLTTLELDRCGDQPLDFSSLPCKNLETLKLKKCKCDLTNLHELLQHQSHLKIVDFWELDLTRGHFNLPKDSCSQLSFAKFYSCGLTSRTLCNFLQASSHLVQLDLSLTKGLMDKPPSMTLDLRYLEKIEASLSDLHSKTFAKICEGAPQLRQVNLSSCKGLSEPFHLAKGSLPRLLDFNVANTHIGSSSLQSLFEAASSLVKCDISHCKNALDPISLTVNALPSLKEIKLSLHQGLSLDTLHRAAPNLSKLTLMGETPTPEDLNILRKMGAIEELYLSLDNMTATDLAAILHALPHIKKLTLNTCRSLEVPLLLPKNSLPKLTHLENCYTKIGNRGFEFFKDAAPLLEEKNVKNMQLSSDLPRLTPGTNTPSPSAPGVGGSGSGEGASGAGGNGGSGEGSDSEAEEETGTDDKKQPKVPNLSSNSLELDAKTKHDKSIRSSVDIIFHPYQDEDMPAHQRYRLNVFDTAEVIQTPCEIGKAFILHKKGPLFDRPIFIPKIGSTEIKSSNPLFIGRQRLSLSREWQSLGSLSPNEVIRRLSTEPADLNINIRYSERDNLYYISSDTPCDAVVSFIVEVKPSKGTLPEEISTLIAEFNTFEDGALKLKKDSAECTGEDYLEAILHDKRGVCRHRALAFKVLMDRHYPQYFCRVITNDSHAFAEVLVDGQWIECQLGGAEANPMLRDEFSSLPDKESSTSEYEGEGVGVEEGKEGEVAKGEGRGEGPEEEGELGLKTKPEEEKKALADGDLEKKEAEDEPEKLFLHSRMVKGDDKEKVSKVTEKEVDPALAYLLDCMHTHKKRIIQCPNKDAIEALHYALLAMATHTKRPIFYVNSPEDLICSEPYIYQNEDKTGDLRPEGGPLYDFLKNNRSGVVLINYDNFSSDDLVQFNSIMDEHRQVDGEDIPKEMVVVGLMNPNNPEVVFGNDFYSRVDKTEICPFHFDLPPFPNPSQTNDPRILKINLFQSQDWESMLLGQWVPDGKGGWCYQDGALQEALTNGRYTGIEIQNGPWNNPKFLQFWRTLYTTGVLAHENRVYPLPETFSITRAIKIGYDWNVLKSAFELTDHCENPVILNEETRAQFFVHQAVEGSQLLNKMGLIEHAASRDPKILSIHVTQSLSEDSMAEILTECKKRGVRLMVSRAPLVEFPADLTTVLPIPKLPELPFENVSHQHTSVIESNDVDVTLAHLIKGKTQPWVVDISECDDSDLLSRVQDNLDKGPPPKLTFSKTVCDVLLALERGETVVLKGRFKDELASALAPLLLQRQSEAHPPGTLILLTHDAAPLQFVPHHVHKVGLEDKLRLLEERNIPIPPALTDEFLAQPYCQLATRCRFIAKAPHGTPSDNAWLGYDRLPEAFTDPGEFVKRDHHTQVTRAFFQKRQEDINRVLSVSPFVFLTGLSGVGKTTYIRNDFCGPKDALYTEFSALAEWANDSEPDTRKILFIDEANLLPTEFSMLEGLMNEAPAERFLLIEGKRVPISDNHKIIFAGNPISFGDERKLAPFFKRHGNTVLFEPMPSSVLYEKMLKPLFHPPKVAGSTHFFEPLSEHDVSLQSLATEISAIWLNVYRFVCTSSPEKINISPRELQMMALLTFAHMKKPGNTDSIEAVAMHYAYHLTKHLVPKSSQGNFHARFAPKPLNQSRSKACPDYVTTESRAQVVDFLDSLLRLRELRQTESRKAPESEYGKIWATGGLGGVILEGEPGIGKSKLAIEILRSHHFTISKKIIEHPRPEQKIAYRMPVNWSFEKKEAFLLKAFHQGAVVIIDEINSSPMMERLINALTMGQTLSGEKANVPGFMLIGTQNPITMAGRRAASTAMNRRLATIELPNYNHQDMVDILLKKGIPGELANRWVNSFEQEVTQAEKQRRDPPTFRDLIKKQKEYQHSMGMKSDAEEALEDASMEEADISHHSPMAK